MPNTSRPASGGEYTDGKVPAPTDPTLLRSGDMNGPARFDPAGEPQFGPPRRPGEVGTLGRYRVLKEIGRGGMGAVYRGFDDRLERRLALKVLLPKYAADDEARARFLFEARSAARIKDEHVVTIHDVGEQGESPFIAMEYLRGLPLDQYLKKRGELPPPQAVRVARETALGLAAAHALGIIHRDVKPANIWLRAPDGHVKLLDFGVARAADEDGQLTGPGVAVGTPAYMSPEQARGLPVDHRTDLFSLGVMLYRLVTGRMPFTGESVAAVAISLATDTPPPARRLNPHLPEALEAVIARLLAKDPAHRFPTAMEVVAALAAVEQPAAGPPPVVVPLRIDPPEQNVWESIDESSDVPVLLDDDTEPVPATRPEQRAKPEPNKPKPNKSKLPLLLCGAAVLLACAAVALAALKPWKANPPAANTDGEKPLAKGTEAKPKEKGEEVKQEAKLPETKLPVKLPDADPDRHAAKCVFDAGGWVRIRDKDGERDARRRELLPEGRFVVTAVQLYTNKKVTDGDLLNANLSACTQLTHLSVAHTNISDVGIRSVMGCKKLAQLFVQKTAVTPAMVEELRQALPNCSISSKDDPKK